MSMVDTSSVKTAQVWHGLQDWRQSINHNVRQFKDMENRTKSRAKDTGKAKVQSTNQEIVQILQLQPPTSTVFSLWEDVWECGKVSHFWAVCRSNGRRGTVHDMQQDRLTNNLICRVSIPYF